MEALLQYTWQHRLYPLRPLATADGQAVEVLDPGLYNRHAGPDFLNARVRIGGTLWVGHVEVHLRSSDWQRHGHHTDEAYNSVVLHVASTLDAPVRTAAGQVVPQLQLDVPPQVAERYDELRRERDYPPCHRALPAISRLTRHGWLAALTTERLEAKTARIRRLIDETHGDWERAAFVTLARGFGFGVNADAFETWATALPLGAAGKHRDDAFQIEALFFGQAGLLDEAVMTPRRRQEALADPYFCRLRDEYHYLAHKFTLTPIDGRLWRFMRLRPQNAPHIRLAQLTDLYLRQTASFSRLIEAPDPPAMRACLAAEARGYWADHYHFGAPSAPRPKRLRQASADGLLINAVAPLLFAYGRYRSDEELAARAFDLLEQLDAEDNHVVRAWAAVGLPARHAADSQALLQLRQAYCQPADCLRCRFGFEFLKGRRSPAAAAPPAP